MLKQLRNLTLTIPMIWGRRRTHDDMAMAVRFDSVRKLSQLGICKNFCPPPQIEAGLFGQRFQLQNHQLNIIEIWEAAKSIDRKHRFRSLEPELFEHALGSLLAGSSRSHLQSFGFRVPFSNSVSIDEHCECKLRIGMLRIGCFE